MSTTLYTLKEDKDTRELHLFRAKPTVKNKCKPNIDSICTVMNKNQSVRNVFACLSEDDARLKCAEIGREVCGNCVRHLYKT